MKTCHHPLDLCNRLPAFVRTCGGGGILLGHNIMVELNLEGYPFPGRSEKKDRQAVSEALFPVLDTLFPADEWIFRAEMNQLTHDERMLLIEREQLTSGMAARADGVHVLINRLQDTYAYINDEEHLMIQTFHPGGLREMQQSHDDAFTLRDKLREQLPVAYDESLGLLFSEPYKVGSGIWVSALLYLPALVQTYRDHDFEEIVNELGVVCLPAFSRTKHPVGGMFWICSPTLTNSRDDLNYPVFHRMIEELCRQEEEARRDILLAESASLNFLHREIENTLLLLTKEPKLSYRSLLHSLSQIRFGLETGLLKVDNPLEDVEQVIAHAYMEGTPTFLRLARKATTVNKQRTMRAKLARKLVKIQLHLLPTFQTKEL